MHTLPVKLFCFYVLFSVAMVLPTIVFARAYYVAPSGDDDNPGTLLQPFATLQRAHDHTSLQAGDVIYLRGGTYYPEQQTVFRKSGNEQQVIQVKNYPGEMPVIDGRDIPEGNTNSSSTPTWKFQRAAYWKIQGPIHLTNGRGAGVYIDEGRFLEFDRIESSYNGKRAARAGHGFFLWGDSDTILFTNCDSHHNANHLWKSTDDQQVHQYQHGDGWRIFGGTNIKLVGCRAWHNLDDGYDFTQAENMIEMIDCWAAYSGVDDSEGSITGTPNKPMSRWEGDGIKLGYGDDTANHRAIRCLSWNNHCHGWTVSGGPYEIYNSAAFNNAEDAFYGIGNEANIRRNTYGFRNRLGNGGGGSDYGSLSLSAGDFLELDDTGMLGPRTPEGDLPAPAFLKLAAGSSLIDTGVNVGISYEGLAPDIGPFEFTAAPSVQGGAQIYLLLEGE